MCFRLAVEMPQKFAGFAAIAAHVPEAGNSCCRAPAAPVSILLSSGTQDPINPFHGGMVSILGIIDKGRVISAMDTASYWMVDAAAEYSSEVRTFPDRDPEDGSQVALHQWTGNNGRTIRLYTVNGGGHTIPGTISHYPSFIVGGTNQDIHIADEIVPFFISLHE